MTTPVATPPEGAEAEALAAATATLPEDVVAVWIDCPREWLAPGAPVWLDSERRAGWTVANPFGADGPVHVCAPPPAYTEGEGGFLHEVYSDSWALLIWDDKGLVAAGWDRLRRRDPKLATAADPKSWRDLPRLLGDLPAHVRIVRGPTEQVVKRTTDVSTPTFRSIRTLFDRNVTRFRAVDGWRFVTVAQWIYATPEETGLVERVPHPAGIEHDTFYLVGTGIHGHARDARRPDGHRDTVVSLQQVGGAPWSRPFTTSGSQPEFVGRQPPMGAPIVGAFVNGPRMMLYRWDVLRDDWVVLGPDQAHWVPWAKETLRLRDDHVLSPAMSVP